MKEKGNHKNQDRYLEGLLVTSTYYDAVEKCRASIFKAKQFSLVCSSVLTIAGPLDPTITKKIEFNFFTKLTNY